MNKVKVVFLGTNGWYDTNTGNTICLLIESRNEYVVLDAGNGLYKLDRYVKTDKPIYLFLSHFHLDHMIGLHVLAKFNFKQGLNICVQKGRSKQFNVFLNKPFTVPVNELKMHTRVLEVGAADQRFPFLQGYLPLHHSDQSMGMRFGFNNKIICYIPDTGVCDNAIKLAQNADLLITECAMRPGEEDRNWPHLNPKTAAQIARKANARKLVLVHFDAEAYQNLQERQWAETKARQTFKNTLAARDGLGLAL